MSKTKLTLYVDKEVSKRAKRISRMTGKSISSIVTEFINKQDSVINDFRISDKVSKSDFVLSNNGSLSFLERQIEALIQALVKKPNV